MKALLPLAALLFNSTLCFSEDPFDHCISFVKKGKIDGHIQTFATECGVSAEERPLYAVSAGGGWDMVRDLPKGIRDTESDFLTTAEVRKQALGPRIVSLWSIDSTAGYEQNTFFCLDRRGHTQSLLAKTFSLPVEGQGSWWCYKERRTYDERGRLTTKNGSFFDKTGIADPEAKA